MKTRQLVILFLLLSLRVFASDSLRVSFNKTNFMQGESVNWQCELVNFKPNENTVTLQLWIENLQNGKIWQYRYPLINGYTEGTLDIANELPNGKYALNFLLQKDFFNVRGTIKDYNRKDTLINYMMLSHDKKTTISVAKVSKDKKFELRNILFQDTALFMFSPYISKHAPELEINLVTSLDSIFKPAAEITKIITVGPVDTSAANKAAAISEKNYSFDFRSKEKTYLLPEFVVKAKRKHIEDFARENVSPMFVGIDDITFDGIDDPEISRSVDIYTFLQTKVAGMVIKFNPKTGEQQLTWRNHRVSIYVNEFKLESGVPLVVNPSDVAMIKVFRPGFEPGNLSSAGGVVAIYTRMGEYEDPASTHKNVFHIRGYESLKTEWKP